MGQELGDLSLVLRKPVEEQNIPKVETVSLDDLRYSYYGSRPPGTEPAGSAAPAPKPIARTTAPRSSQIVRRAAQMAPRSSTVSVTRGMESRDYEVGGYAQ